MDEQIKTKARAQIAHVLFLDIVGYSKLLIDEQTEALEALNQIVRNTGEARGAEASGQLIFLPTGDGMALVFTGSVEDPVECALQISRALQGEPGPPVRMGIHSGPVDRVADVNRRGNIAGAGINIAQRVMDCGDAGHILLSQRLADDLAQFRRWQPFLHNLGDCEVKHGVVVSLVNLYGEGIGNPAPPSRLKAMAGPKKPARFPWHETVIALLLLGALLAAGFFFFRQRSVSEKLGVTPAAISDKSIAVLPFANLSSDRENAYFADGVQDQILTNLARIADLKVVSRTSVMQYQSDAKRNLREIGRQLGVAYVLEGSVQRSGNQVRVNAQLIDARTDNHQWAQFYDRPLDDVFAIQSEIAKTIAEQLRARLSPGEKAAIAERLTTDVTAFSDYSRARTLLLTSTYSLAQVKNYFQGVEILNGVVARDPSFYEAYCQLVFAHDRIYAWGTDRTPARLTLAGNALQSATALRPDVPETHLARANHFYFGFRDYKGALAELEIARRGLTNDPRIYELTGYILRRQGKKGEALRHLQRAVELDPRNVYTLVQTAYSYQQLRHYPEEIAALDRALEIAPDNVAIRSSRAAVEFYWKGDTRPLHRFFEHLQAERPSSLSDTADNWLVCALAERDWPAAEQALVALGTNNFWIDEVIELSHHFAEGLLARAMSDEPRAKKAFSAARVEQEQIVKEQADFAAAHCVLGLIDAALGNKDAALQAGRRSIELLEKEEDPPAKQGLIAYQAMISAWAGEKDLALQQLARAVRSPGGVVAVKYGILKLFPFWDALRGDPRFEKLVASQAPK